jgi:hypothetical protein
VFDLLRLQAGPVVQEYGTAPSEAITVSEWDWKAPRGKREMAQGSEGSVPIGSDDAYEDRQVSITLDPSGGNVPGDPETGNVSNLVWGRKVRSMTWDNPGSGDVVVSFAADSGTAPQVPEAVDASLQVWVSVEANVQVAVGTSSDVYASKTLAVAAGKWTTITVLGAATGGVGPLAVAASANLPEGETLRARCPVIGAGTGGAYFDARTPGVSQAHTGNLLSDPKAIGPGWSSGGGSDPDALSEPNVAIPDNSGDAGLYVKYNNPSTVADALYTTGQAYLPVVPGRTYHLRAEAYADVAPAGSSLQLVLGPVIGPKVPLAAGQRVTASISAVIPAGTETTQVSFYIWQQGTTSPVEVYLTSFMLSPDDTDASYDGDSPGWTWGAAGDSYGPYGPATRPANGERWMQAVTRSLNAACGATGASDSATLTRFSTQGQTLTFDVNGGSAEVEENNDYYLGLAVPKLELTCRPLARGDAITIPALDGVRGGVAALSTATPIPGDVPALVDLYAQWPTTAGDVAEAIVQTGPQTYVAGQDCPGEWRTAPSPPLAGTSSRPISGPLSKSTLETAAEIPVPEAHRAAGSASVMLRVACYKPGSPSTFSVSDPSTTYVEWSLAVDGAVQQTLRTAVYTGLDSTTSSPWRLLRFGPVSTRGQITVKARVVYPAGWVAPTGVIDFAVLGAPDAASTMLRAETFAPARAATWRDDFSTGTAPTLNGRRPDYNPLTAVTWTTSGLGFSLASYTDEGKTVATATPATFSIPSGRRVAMRVTIPAGTSATSATLTHTLGGGPRFTVELKRLTATSVTATLSLKGTDGATIIYGRRLLLGSAATTAVDLEIGVDGSGHWRVSLTEAGRSKRGWAGHSYAFSSSALGPSPTIVTAGTLTGVTGAAADVPWLSRVRSGSVGRTGLSIVNQGTRERPITGAMAEGPRPTLPPGRPAQITILAADSDTETPYDGPRPTSASAHVTPRYLQIPEVLESAGEPAYWEPGASGPYGGGGGGSGTPGGGSAWHSGSGAPANDSYVEGDWYLDETTGDVYEKTATAAWTLQTNIQGADGPPGPAGPAGPINALLDGDDGAWTNANATVSSDDRLILPAGHGGGGSGVRPFRHRWVRNVRGGTSGFADGDPCRLEIGWLLRDLANYTIGSGVMLTVRTNYFSGGSYVRVLLVGGYTAARPWKVYVIDMAGEQPLVPRLGAERRADGLTGSESTQYFLETPVYVDIPAANRVNVEIETDLPIETRPVTLTPGTAKLSLTGTQTVLTGPDVTAMSYGLAKASNDNARSLGRVPTLTALPTNPWDAEEIYLQTPAMLTAGVRWHLRYRYDGVYKWEFLGGGSLTAKSGLTAAFTTPATGSTWQQEGVSVTAPLAGDYEVSFSWNGLTTLAQAQFEMDVRTAATANAGLTGTTNGPASGPTPANQLTHMTASGTLLGVAASASMALYSSTPVASVAGSHRFRSVTVRPIRVG